MGLFCCLHREETEICLPIVLRSNFNNKQFSLKKKKKKFNYNFVPFDVVTSDVDRSVSTAYSYSSSGDEVDWVRVTYMLLWLAVIGWNSTF